VNWRGNWLVGTIYYTNDAVYYNGTTYRAKTGSTGITPGTAGTKWVYLARAGATGSQGPGGSDGLDGADGAAGPQGVPGRLDAPGYSATNVDDPVASVGREVSITIGADGLAIVAQHDSTAQALRVTHCNNIACTSATSTTVDDPASWVGADTSVAIGTDGLAIISHLDADNNALRVTHCSNAACTSASSTTVDDPADLVGAGSSIAIGSDGLAIISHRNLNEESLRVTHCNDVECTSATSSEPDNTASNLGWDSSIAIGPDGRPIIAHFDDTADGLRVSHCGDITCSGATSTTVDDPIDTVGTASSIAIGPDGYAIIAHRVFHLGFLRVTHCSNASCTAASSTDLDTSAGNLPSIAIGADGLPVIAHGGDGFTVRVTRCREIACATATNITADDPADQVGVYTALAIGIDGLPIIAHLNNTLNALRVTHCSNVYCVPYHRP
jgi:hypothetical protein